LLSVKILRDLWRLRLAVAVIGILALLVAWRVAFVPSFPPKSRSYEVSVATARILVDTPNSQVVEVAPKGSEALGARANVLANLMVDGEVKDAIARRAGLGGRKLYAGVQTADGLPIKVPATPDVLVLTTAVVTTSDQSELPIIKVDAQAPTTQEALGLANAAVAGLGDYLNRKATDESVSDARRLRVSALGTAQAHDSTRGTGKMMALAMLIFLFSAGCAALLGACALVRGWRAAVAGESKDEPVFTGLLDDDLEPFNAENGAHEFVPPNAAARNGADAEPSEAEPPPTRKRSRSRSARVKV
jgi:hypothetical protein